MALFQILLMVALALGISTMLSGFMLARRMGYYLMPQIMLLMIAMLLSILTLGISLLVPPLGIMLDYLHLLMIGNLVIVLIATILEFVQVFPILLKTMQGGPIHSSHITNLLVLFFLLLGIVIYYPEIVVI